ncbi:hypothetical protein VTL71DRAFT_15916 [Oculimacula yallundae]|uniref:Peptidase A1 domain-containing protein n=1 Tax=Oculimacula yallundae TaxID=86028 RepID=A0ABR4CD01_9HELO
MYFASFILLAAVPAPVVQATSLTTTHLDGGLIVPMILSKNQTAYMAQVSAGTPAQIEFLKVDTGSPTYSFLSSYNPVCSEATKPCQTFGTFDNLTSSTSIYEGPGFSDRLGDYGTGDFLNDSVTIGGTKVDHMYFGYLNQYGYPERAKPLTTTILGLSLSCAGVVANTTCNEDGPYILPQLKKAKTINRMSASVYLGPDDLGVNNSELIFGGYMDKAKIGGPLISLPMVDPTTYLLSGGQTNNVNVTSLEVVFNGNSTSGTYGEPDFGQPALFDTGSVATNLPSSIFYAIYGAFGGSSSTYNRDLRYQNIDCKYRDPQNTKGALNIGFGAYGNVSIPLHRLVTPFDNGNCGMGTYPTSDGSVGIFGDDILRSLYLIYDQESFTLTLSEVKYTSEQNIVPFP